MLTAHNSTTVNHTVLRLILGPLETQVMEILWALRRVQGAGSGAKAEPADRLHHRDEHAGSAVQEGAGLAATAGPGLSVLAAGDVQGMERPGRA